MLGIALCLRPIAMGQIPVTQPSEPRRSPLWSGASRPAPTVACRGAAIRWAQTWADNIGERLQELEAPHED